MYKIEFSSQAKKNLKKIAKKDKPDIFSALFNLRENPYLGKKLSGKLKNQYSLRIRIYRIIYRIYKSKLTILILRIGHRQGVYK